MAIKKKAENLTIEEKLAQALVPESEQPYKVPKNWCWVRLDSLYSLNPKNVADSKIDAAFIPMEKVSAGMLSDFSYEVQTWEKAKKGHTQFADGDVAFAKISPCFENRKSMVLNDLPNGIGGGTTELIVLRQPLVNNRYTFWLITDERFINGGINTYSGTVGQQRISTDYVKSYQVPLAPLVEQQRIVERIESLFAKLDEAKEKLQEVLDGFETRKAAILHKAFTGELTAKWREEHGVSLDSWEKKKIKDVCIPRAGYAFDSKKFCESGYQVLRMGNLYAGELDLSRNPVFIDVADVNDDMLAKAKINDSDVLLTLTGTKYKRDYGYAVKVTEPVNLLLNQRILCLTPNNINGDYFLHYLRSKMFRDIFFSNETGGVNQGNVSSKFVENIEVTLPCGKEQNVIAQKLNVFIDKYNRSRQVVQDGINQVDFIKKAILARAFRGELGTNDENDECAVELLKKVL